MRAIVTVKLKRDPIHDPRNKIVGSCPLGGRTSKCTDVTGSHHSYIEVGKDLDDIYARAKRKHGHVTRVEVLKSVKGDSTSFPDVDELREGEKYPDKLYLDSDWMQDLFQVYVYAEGLNISFRRPGHNLEIVVEE